MTDATAEIAILVLLGAARRAKEGMEWVKKKDWTWSANFLIGKQLTGSRLGILGMGRLGKITAKIASGFGMKVLGCDIKKKKIKNVKMVSIKKLFSTSDIISIHIHLNKKTAGLVNKKLFKQMKKNSILINTSRGGIINENDLSYALKNNLIVGAGLDIIKGEWLSRSELLKHKLIKYAKNNYNLLIVPHIGGSTFESISGARRFICNKLLKEYKNYNI